MLSQKLAALLALIVFASQGAMAAPSSPPRSSVADSVVTTAGSALGRISAATLPANLVEAAIEADEGKAPANDHRGGTVEGLLETGSSTAGSIGAIVFPAEFLEAGNKGAEDYYKYVNNHLFSIPLLLTFFPFVFLQVTVVW